MKQPLLRHPGESRDPVCKPDFKNMFKTWIPAFAGMTTVLLLSNFSPLNALKTGGNVKASFVSEVESIQPGQPFSIALRLEMNPEWHTYWINPGESGAPTKIKWTLPSGFTAGPIQWPHPQKIVVPPVVTYGYEKETWLLNTLTPPNNLTAGQTITLKAKVDWLECKVECIPGEANLSISLPVSPNAVFNKNLSDEFSLARSKLPLSNSEWALEATANNKTIQIFITPPSWHLEPLTALDFYSQEFDVVDYAAPQNHTSKKGLYTLTIKRSDTSEAPLTRLNGMLVAEPGWRGTGSEKALMVNIPIKPRLGNENSPVNGFLLPLLFAFLGGLLLNLMPCVLPVLSIKILGFVEHQPHNRSVGIKQSLAFALGILVSFWALAGLLLFLRAGGQQLGWGFQMQSPPFVFLLTSLFFMLGLNLLGVFEVGASLTQLGDISPRSGSYGKSFLSGTLTTLVATPCTAPFMGSALGYAISQSTTMAMGIFTSLAIGVAAPYVVLSSFPRLLAFVPKPGAWMDTMKHMMGFLMMGTVLWLLWVLDTQRGGIIIPTLFVLLVHGLAGWVLGRWDLPHKSKTTRRLALFISLLMVAASLIWGYRQIKNSKPPSSSSAQKESQLSWEPYSDERVSNYRSQGRPVFVDFTAAWCLTCQVNKRVALHTPEVEATFREKNVATLKADWTSYDPLITQALQKFGRSGVPFYVLYSSKEDKEPTTLPEILTPSIVVKALENIN